MKPKHLDLFTGLGSFSIAARLTGYETVAHAEIEPFCNALLTKRFPRVPNVGDVRKIARTNFDCEGIEAYPDFYSRPEPGFDDGASDLLFCPVCTEEAGYPIDFGDCECIGAQQFGEEHGYPDLITAGSPCQDFSVAGKGAGIKGARSGLVMEIPRIGAALGIPFVLVENVAGILNRGFDEWATAMEEVGYKVWEPFSLQALAFGFSHRRERVFAIAHNQGIRMEGVRFEGIQEPQPLDRASLSVRHRDGQWKAEPDIRRDPHGFPAGMDRSRPKHTGPRVKALGNSVPPQIAGVLMDFIKYYAAKGQALCPAL